MKKIDLGNTTSFCTTMGTLFEMYKHTPLLLKIYIEIYSKGFRVSIKPWWSRKAHIYQFKWNPKQYGADNINYKVYFNNGEICVDIEPPTTKGEGER